MLKIIKPEQLNKRLKIAMIGKPGEGKSFSSMVIGDTIAKLKGVQWVYLSVGEADNIAFYQDQLSNFQLAALDDSEATNANYIAAVKQISAEGYQGAIIDSISNQWAGSRGLVSETTGEASHVKFHKWAQASKKHQLFLNALTAFNRDLICTIKETESIEIDPNTNEVTRTVNKLQQRKTIKFDFSLVLRCLTVYANPKGQIFTAEMVEEMAREARQKSEIYIQKNGLKLIKGYVQIDKINNPNTDMMQVNEIKKVDRFFACQLFSLFYNVRLSNELINLVHKYHLPVAPFVNPFSHIHPNYNQNTAKDINEQISKLNDLERKMATLIFNINN